MDCIFCKIAKGEIPSSKVYEDEDFYAFLDISPANKGHTLVIPKLHVARLEELNFEDCEALFKSVYELVSVIQEAVNAPSTTIAINNGVESGQEVQHVHVHIIPRFKNDGGGPIHILMKRRPHIKLDVMIEIAQKILDSSK